MRDELIRDAFEEIVGETPPPPALPIREPGRRSALARPILAVTAGALAVTLIFGWQNLIRSGDLPEPVGTVPPPAQLSTTTIAPVTTMRVLALVPDVVGLDFETATAIIEQAGFIVTLDDSTGQDAGTVAGQLPVAGDPAEAGAVVLISSRPACAIYEALRESEEDVAILYPCRLPDGDPNSQRVWRSRQPGEDQLTAIFRQLLAGPTDFERNLSFSSVFSRDTAGALASIAMENGVLHVELTESIYVTNRGTTAGAADMQAELLQNAFTVDEVETVEISVEGSCEAWATFLEETGCRSYTREDLKTLLETVR